MLRFPKSGGSVKDRLKCRSVYNLLSLSVIVNFLFILSYFTEQANFLLILYLFIFCSTF